MHVNSLIERIKNNDGENVIKDIYQKYRREFVHWARHTYGINAMEAREVFQQSVVKVYENACYDKIINKDVKVKTYVFGIGKNKILELIRHRGRILEQTEEEWEMPVNMYFNDFNEEYESLLLRVKESLEQMGDPCKSILKYYYYHRHSMEKIAELLHYKNKETVKNIKYKCFCKLKAIFHLTASSPQPSDLS